MKKLFRILMVIVVLGVVGAGALWYYIDSVAAKALVAGVEYAGDTTCTVDSVGVSLLTGSVDIADLVIHNPKGCTEGEMFNLGRAELEVAIKSLWYQPVHVRRLEIIGPVIVIEGAGLGKTNISVFIDNITKKIPEGDDEEEDDGPPTRLKVRGARIQLGQGIDKKGFASVELDEFELIDVHGKDGQGVTSGELMAKILLECATRGAPGLNVNLSGLIPKDLTKGLEAATGPIGDIIKGSGDILKGPIGTLLGGKKKE